MSETARERAKKLANDYGRMLLEEWDVVRDKPDLLEDMFTKALRAHATAALERAWNASASIETTGKDPQRIQDEMLAAIRALKSEEE